MATQKRRSSKAPARLKAAPQLALEDRAYNAGIDVGGHTGLYSKLAFNAALSGAKKGSAVTTNFSLGFAKGLALGWKSA